MLATVRPQASAKIPICTALRALCGAASGRETGAGTVSTSGIELMRPEYVAGVAAAFPQGGVGYFN